ncbi:MAG: hypothetical protein RID91_06555 [Azospirillaceae bacterium]
MQQILRDEVEALYRLWQVAARGSWAPRPDALDVAADHPDLAPYHYRVAVVDNGRDFRYDHVGAHLIAHIGVDFTGRRVSAFMTDYEQPGNADGYAAALRTGKPTVSIHDLRNAAGDYVIYERLLCPLSSDGRRVDALFGAMAFWKPD